MFYSECARVECFSNRLNEVDGAVPSGGNYGGLGGSPPPQSAMSLENSGFRRIIDNHLTCRNYSKYPRGLYNLSVPF